jgi:uncharacterized membrane protein
MSDDIFIPNNVLVVTFEDDQRAYEAISVLNELDAQGQLQLTEAAVVTRRDDGQVIAHDQTGDPVPVNTLSGGLIGLLVGVLGGPLGVLIGGATGLLAGSLFDLDDADDTDSVLSEMSKSIRVGHTALLAQVEEQSPEIVDAAMARLSGTVVRRPTYDVEVELEAAREAQSRAKREARKELLKARHEKNKAEAHEKVEAMKAKLHHDKTPAGAGS